MTIDDLVQEFEITYDIGSLGLPGFTEDEIKKLLELSQYRAISQKYGGNNAYGQKYPESNKRIDDLSGLIVYDRTGVGGSGNLQYGASFINTGIITLPDDFLHLVEIRIKFADNKVELAKQIKISESMRFSESKYNSGAFVRNPAYCFVESLSGNRKLRLHYDQTEADAGNPGTIDEILCLYIKKPTNLETVAVEALTDFNDDVYHEIVAGAVDHAINIATPNKSQISQQQLNKVE